MSKSGKPLARARGPHDLLKLDGFAFALRHDAGGTGPELLDDGERLLRKLAALRERRATDPSPRTDAEIQTTIDALEHVLRASSDAMATVLSKPSPKLARANVIMQRLSQRHLISDPAPASFHATPASDNQPAKREDDEKP